MQHLLGTDRHAEVLNSIKQFLDTESISPDEKRLCSGCGAALRYRNADFWLYESEKSWRIRLPYCPECDSEAMRSETFAA